MAKNKCCNCDTGPANVACDNCFGDEGPPSFQVVVSGFSDNGCSGCSNFDGTYVCDFVSQVGVTCTWESETTSSASCNDPGKCIVEIFWQSLTSKWIMNVRITNVLIGYQWTNSYTTIPSCLAFSSEPVGDGSSLITAQCVRPGYAYVTAL